MPGSPRDALPAIIQGGMGIGVSNWTLARAVSRLGQLGVVSGTAIDTVLVRRLQDGDPGGHVRRAMEHFPIAGVAERVLERYFLPCGRSPSQPYAMLSMYRASVSVARQQITMLANFVEVWLAKEGHDGVVGVNLLTKVQMPNLASLYGAMLAGVDYVLMGAGIPREIPGALDALARHEPASLKLDVDGASDAPPVFVSFDPSKHTQATDALTRPRFLAIVSAHSLAATLARKATGRVDGFVVEGPTAGGHNAPPRGELQLSAEGEPLYGDRDLVDLAKMREIGLPFWLAGGVGTADAVRAAREHGAAGVQVGTLFAYCDESGLAPTLRAQVIAGVAKGATRIRTDPRASPTGYPFKVVEVGGMPRQDDTRVRVCDLGYLRTAYRTASGRLDYRCPAEPVESYLGKGGRLEDTVGRRCLCNGLTANIGLPQRRGEAGEELPLITSGDDLASVLLLAKRRGSYGAGDVIAHLLGGTS
jgi:NAD(P)H-dependent flavin oxidoreductase YrpB (nitropropane dioxygenase family)